MNNYSSKEYKKDKISMHRQQNAKSCMNHMINKIANTKKVDELQFFEFKTEHIIRTKGNT